MGRVILSCHSSLYNSLSFSVNDFRLLLLFSYSFIHSLDLLIYTKAIGELNNICVFLKIDVLKLF